MNLKPEEIPQYTGHLETLEKDHAALRKDAENIRSTGADVHSHFQGLSAFYKAPEAEQLFATTKPVKDRADAFASDLETVASALADYADEIRPLKTKLENLKVKAQAFIRDHKDDDDGDYDEELTAEHNQIRDDINATVAAFWAAERACYNKIVALWNGPKMVAGDGSKKEHQYGFNAEDLKNAKVPWGDPVEQKHHWYDVGHWLKSFAWDGIVVDGIWGTIKGLGTLVGVDGWDAAGQAWKGLAQLATGLTLAITPGVQTLFWILPDDKLPSWVRDSRKTMKETGKALVAWDEWGKNPARAAGGVTFNVLTTVFTGGAGGAAAGAGKAGAVAKAVSVAGKVGKAIDPMTYVGRAAGAGLSKIGDIAKSIRGIGKVDVPPLPDNAVELPEGTVHLPDGTVHLPEGASIPKGAVELPNGGVKLPDDVPALPEGTAKLPASEGVPAQYVDPQGNILDGQGNTLQQASDAPRDFGNPHSLDADAPHVDTPVREPALAGAGFHTSDTTSSVAHSGDALSDGGRLGDNIDGSPGQAGNHLPHDSAADHLQHGHAEGSGRNPSAGHETTAEGRPGSHGNGPDHHGGSGHEHPAAHDADNGAAHSDHGGAGHMDLDDSPGHTDHDGETAHAAPHDGPGLEGKGTPTPTPQTHPLGENRDGFSMMAKNDPFYREALKSKPFPGHYDVVAHGTPHNTLMDTAGGRELTPRQLADVIRRRPDYTPGTPIRLLSCNTGHLDGTFASQLARDLRAPVVAPDGFLYADRWGRFGVCRERKMFVNNVPGLPDSFYRYHPGGYQEKIPRSEWTVD
ncbi:hypothetical protein C3486_08510 [Streptomyces sp. Ru73]|nr:hypothetical protein C3486_08510 [Streptomyces sp. Ru73]